MFKVRIRGVDRVIRNLASASDDVHDGARRGCNSAAEYLAKKIRAKFGKYNPTGGDPGGYGAWKRLKIATRIKKARKYGSGDNPLIATGETVGSITIVEGGVGRLAASVGLSGKIAYHVYGAPGAGVPMRDPARVTAKEEKDQCHKIVEDYIREAMRRSGL